uniref:Uncharacterized protein n=1 Tax=Anguilla anguilla TaxID=7936 RepID=A0A0E9SGA5_ANGAN
MLLAVIGKVEKLHYFFPLTNISYTASFFSGIVVYIIYSFVYVRQQLKGVGTFNGWQYL